MKKRKGFTLIEIIVTISLLALISTIILLSISSAKQKHNEEAWVKLTARIKSAASAYIEDSEGLKALVYGGTTVYVQVADLISAGILDENYIIDPTDGVNVLDKESVIYQTVKVFLNANDALEYIYPAYSGAYVTISPTRVIGYTNTALDYLSGVRLFNDNGIEVSNTAITNIQKTGGKIYTSNHTIVFTSAGEYTLTYTFNNVNYTRTYYISAASGEVINPSDPEPLINPDQVYTDPGYTYVPVLDGTYTIRVYGAEGGNSGGNGGYVSGNVSLTASDTLTIIVGGTPDSEGVGGYNGGGIGAYGGGGSSIVKLNGTNIIIAAGGGGGATGTAGGEDDSTGGAAVETDKDLETETTYTPTAGTAGTDGSGGGSGNKYNMCLAYNEVYDACATTTNTCSYGCGTCSYAIYCRPCSTDGGPWTCEGSYTYRCGYAGDCSPCVIKRWASYSCNCSSCYYGSPTTCVAGYVKGDCTSLGDEETKPGKGGTSMATSAVLNATKTSGLKTGDGRVEIKVVQEGSGS
jgi:prepilin-type N-terminal cleavage/methylation domain-containing protein